MDELIKQIWYCPECRAIGCVVYPKKDATDIMSIANLIRDQHKMSSPRCLLDVKIIALENINKNTIITYGSLR